MDRETSSMTVADAIEQLSKVLWKHDVENFSLNLSVHTCSGQVTFVQRNGDRVAIETNSSILPLVEAAGLKETPDDRA